MIGLHDQEPRPIVWAERQAVEDELEEQIDTIRGEKEILAQKLKEVSEFY